MAGELIGSSVELSIGEPLVPEGNCDILGRTPDALREKFVDAITFGTLCPRIVELDKQLSPLNWTDIF